MDRSLGWGHRPHQVCEVRLHSAKPQVNGQSPSSLSFYNTLNTMRWNLHVHVSHPLHSVALSSSQLSHKRERSGSSCNQTPINVHYTNWQPSSAQTLMYTGYSPSVTTSKQASIYTHFFGGLSSSEPSLQVITPLNSSISVIIPSADTQHHTTERCRISELNVFSFPVEQGSKISENETPLKVGQDAGEEVGGQGWNLDPGEPDQRPGAGEVSMACNRAAELEALWDWTETLWSWTAWLWETGMEAVETGENSW